MEAANSQFVASHVTHFLSLIWATHVGGKDFCFRN